VAVTAETLSASLMGRRAQQVDGELEHAVVDELGQTELLGHRDELGGASDRAVEPLHAQQAFVKLGLVAARGDDGL
jgi:hypothetical protein